MNSSVYRSTDTCSDGETRSVEPSAAITHNGVHESEASPAPRPTFRSGLGCDSTRRCVREGSPNADAVEAAHSAVKSLDAVLRDPGIMASKVESPAGALAHS
jgi:hypothetical protein